jgi:hypothetical protein
MIVALTLPADDGVCLGSDTSLPKCIARETCGDWAGESASCGVRCRANGLEVHLRGQGPRAEANAAHGVHACESRDAGRAPPCRFDFPRQLGCRTEAGPRQVLARVRRHVSPRVVRAPDRSLMIDIKVCCGTATCDESIRRESDISWL